MSGITISKYVYVWEYYSVSALKYHQISPEDINYVVCTHSHADHIGNNNLFTNADQHIIGSCIQNRTRFHELIQNQSEINIL